MPSGVSTLRFNEGEFKGAALVGLLRAITADGIAVVLDGGLFSRGTSVQVQLDDGSQLRAWVRECTTADESSCLELSLTPIELSDRLAVSCHSG